MKLKGGGCKVLDFYQKKTFSTPPKDLQITKTTKFPQKVLTIYERYLEGITEMDERLLLDYFLNTLNFKSFIIP